MVWRDSCLFRFSEQGVLNHKTTRAQSSWAGLGNLHHKSAETLVVLLGRVDLEHLLEIVQEVPLPCSLLP
jgi:hypothetical protein